jgi:hypothetical protein
MNNLSSELRQAGRFLRRRPVFSGAIVLTVALAIAATTLAFAVVDGVLLEPLPYAKPDRLVVVWEHNVKRGRDRNSASPANFLTWREELRSFDALASVVELSTTVLGQGEPERVGAMQASPVRSSAGSTGTQTTSTEPRPSSSCPRGIGGAASGQTPVSWAERSRSAGSCGPSSESCTRASTSNPRLGLGASDHATSGCHRSSTPARGNSAGGTSRCSAASPRV